MTEQLVVPAPGVRSAPPGDVASADAPYVGLRPYSSADAAFFFGRAEERRIIAANACASRLTVLYGPSGVGKSSVLDGGVVHDLAEAVPRRATQALRFAAVVFREWSKWRDDPMAGVARAVHEGLKQHYGIELEPVAGDDFPATVHAWMTAQRGGLIVILDQFEEYLLYQDPARRDSFEIEFPRALADHDLRVNFVLSLREDALGQLDRFKGSIPGLLDNRLPLKLLSRSAAEEAIRKPLDELRARGKQVTIEEELVTAVLGVEHGVAAGSIKLGQLGQGDLPERAAQADPPVEAPYLQLVLERVWKEEQSAGSSVLRLATFERLGWAQRIVQEHLDARMGRLAAADQDMAARLFRHLVTPSGAKIALSAADLAQLTGLAEPAVLPVLEDLAQGDARVLRSIAPPNDNARERRFEIFHDALARAALDWTARREKIVDEARVRAADERYRLEYRKKVVARGAAAVLFAGVLLLLGMQYRQTRTMARESQARALSAAAVRSLEDDPQRALLLALRAAALTYRRGDRRLLPDVDEALHRALLASRPQTVFYRGRGAMRAVAASPEGTRLATADERGAVILWDAATERQIRTLTTTAGFVTALVFAPDGRHLLVASSDSATRIWDTSAAGDPVVLRGQQGGVMAAAFNPLLPLVLTGDAEGGARIWDTRSGEPLRSYGASSRDTVWAVGFAGEGSLVVTGGSGGAKVWDRVSGAVRCAFRGDGGQVFAIAPLSSDPELVASGGRGYNLYIWEPTTCREVSTLVGHRNSTFDIAVRHDGQYLATASADGTVRLWSAANGSGQAVLRGRAGYAVSVAFSAEGDRLYTAWSDSTVLVSDASPLESEVPILEPDRGDAFLTNVRFNPARPQLVALVWPRTALFSDLRKPRASFRATLRSGASALDITMDGMRVAVGGYLGIDILDSRTGNLLRHLDLDSLASDTLRPRFVQALAFSPDGALLAAGDAGGLLVVWDSASKRSTVVRAHRGRIVGVAFGRGGDRLITAGDDGAAIVWSVGPELRPVDTLSIGDGLTAVAFDRNAERIAVAGKDRSIRVRSIADRRDVATLSGHTSSVRALAFSSDGAWLVSAGMDRTVRVWNVDSAKEVLWLPRHRGSVNATAISSDNAFIASAGEGGDVRLSIVEAAALLSSARAKVQRTLTEQECREFMVAPPALLPWSVGSAPRGSRPCFESAAHVLAGRRAAERGALAEAAREFAQARAVDPTLADLDPDSMARAVAVSDPIERAHRYLWARRVPDAIREFRRANALDRARASDVVPEMANTIAGVLNALQTGDSSRVGPLLDAYEEVVQPDTTFQPTAETLNSLCWWGSLAGYAGRVAKICQTAVLASPGDGNIRDSRGVNRALTGDRDGALEDFRAFVAAADVPSQKARRQRWIQVLSARGNPFTPTELAELRRE